MRFKPYGRTAFEDTPRKRAALARKQQNERRALPLFAAEIGEQQPEADQVMAERAARWKRNEQRMRDFHASCWRDARQRFYAMPAPQRQAFRRWWNTHACPATCIYFAEFLRMYQDGRLVIRDLIAEIKEG